MISAMRFAPKPENDFASFIRTYYHECRYENGKTWTPLGVVPNTGQTYSAVVYQGRICPGTWPTGTVFRFDGPQAPRSK